MPRRPNGRSDGVLKKFTAVYLPILVVASVFLLIFFGDKGLSELKTMEAEKRRIVGKNDALVRKNLSLHQTVVRLKNDLKFIEDVARRDLGLVKENEWILKPEKQTESRAEHE
jgi:cell division protein FtsB